MITKYSYFAQFTANLQPPVPKKWGCKHQRSLMPLAGECHGKQVGTAEEMSGYM